MPKAPSPSNVVPPADLDAWIDNAIATTPIFDLHTHLYPSTFGPMMLWGIDELLTYHYLIGETIRATGIAYSKFWAMSQSQQADFVWRSLFIERTPISEACRGVLTVLGRLGLDLNARKLDGFRAFFKDQKPAKYVDRVFELANLRSVVMTNDPMDDVERPFWLDKRLKRDPRFKAVLRIDPLLLGWPKVAEKLRAMSYEGVDPEMDGQTMSQVRRYLNEWIDRLDALYVACSLPPTWRYPDEGMPSTRILNECVLPVCRERNLPFALMIGVTRAANPQLRLAGDALGKADLSSLHHLCVAHPKNRFMATVLSRENQHELAVAARLQPNLYVFGCWWYVNNPSLIEEITTMRVEMLGTDFTPQHSDARVLDQVIYKWDHSRRVIAGVLKKKFADLARTGWNVTPEQVSRTVEGYLSSNIVQFLSAGK